MRLSFECASCPSYFVIVRDKKIILIRTKRRGNHGCDFRYSKFEC